MYVAERSGVALGVLTQKLGYITQPLGYLSNQLDSVVLWWPSCLCTVAATALLALEANKLTLGHVLEVQSPHQVQGVVEIKGHHWLRGSRLTKCQALLSDTPEITLTLCHTLNLATLMLAELLRR